MKTPEQWREQYPVAVEVVREIQADALRHAANLADHHAVGRNCETCIAIAYAVARNIRHQVVQMGLPAEVCDLTEDYTESFADTPPA
jgi:bacterioferritin-associated ferredoxin